MAELQRYREDQAKEGYEFIDIHVGTIILNYRKQTIKLNYREYKFNQLLGVEKECFIHTKKRRKPSVYKSYITEVQFYRIHVKLNACDHNEELLIFGEDKATYEKVLGILNDIVSKQLRDN